MCERDHTRRCNCQRTDSATVVLRSVRDVQSSPQADAEHDPVDLRVGGGLLEETGELVEEQVSLQRRVEAVAAEGEELDARKRFLCTRDEAFRDR